MFLGSFKESVSVLQDNLKKKLQGCFKNVSMKFCLTKLLLHGSHRSYPSRRRACSLAYVMSAMAAIL